MQKLSFNELNEKKDKLKELLDNEKEYSFDLVYSVNKNIKRIENEIEEVKEVLPNYPEELKDYQREKFELFKEYGGVFEQTKEGGVSLSNLKILEDEDLQEELDSLSEKYKGALKKEEEINRERVDKINNKVIEIDWYPIKKEYFPKNIQPKELPIEIIDLIQTE